MCSCRPLSMQFADPHHVCPPAPGQFYVPIDFPLLSALLFIIIKTKFGSVAYSVGCFSGGNAMCERDAECSVSPLFDQCFFSLQLCGPTLAQHLSGDFIAWIQTTLLLTTIPVPGGSTRNHPPVQWNAAFRATQTFDRWPRQSPHPLGCHPVRSSVLPAPLPSLSPL